MAKKIPPVKHDAPGMRGERGRNESGPLREVRGDKQVGTIEAEYGVDFHVRSNMRLDTLRERLGVDSMKQLLKHATNKED